MKPALPALAALAALATAALVTFGLTRGEHGQVIGSPHDLGVAAAGGVSTCEVCHLPGNRGAPPLWSEDPHTGDESFSGIAPACYSCHDGTVSVSGVHVFDEATAQHPVERGEPGEDCDMCHDPHLADYGSFLLFPAGANLCRTCHAGGGSAGHPLNIDPAAAGKKPRDDRWDPGSGDFSGTRLWDEEGSRPGPLLKCLSCHAAHGGATEDLLSIPLENQSLLCANCHGW